MGIQKINFLSIKTNTPNFLGEKKNKFSNLITAASHSRSERNIQGPILVNVASKVDKSNQIDDYIKASKKEVKILEKKADKHKSQCKRILKKAKKDEYKHMIHWGKYNVNFGDVDKITKMPASINFWKDGKFAQQYNIKSLNPTNIQVYNCENKDNIEELFINDYGFDLYKAHNPIEGTIELISPMHDGYSKVEGKYNRCDNIFKTKEIEYLYSDAIENKYFEYDGNDCQGYEYNDKTKKWMPILDKRRTTIKFT